jgi:FkbH-like protein
MDCLSASATVQPQQFHLLFIRIMQKHSIKCVVWDLDNTLWQGVLLEDDVLKLRPGITEVIKTLDERGILQSVASRNDPEKALQKLREFDLLTWFLYPQISWNPKSSSLTAIATALNIGLDTFAFVDDDLFEREEVKFSHPDILCIDAADVHQISQLPEMNPETITEDSRTRRLMYLANIEREREEETFSGPKEEFLATLEMVCSIEPARETDLARAEELTIRTHQLNSTGITYSFEELAELRQTRDHKLLIAGLSDKYGSYGKIGLALIQHEGPKWTIKLLLMSCRVMSRGVGTMMLSYIMEQARIVKATLCAEFVPTDSNRMMYVTLKFAGFKETARQGNVVIMENDLKHIQPLPPYVTLR